jgi:hypothetical protein
MSPVTESVRIGILGDFNPELRSHHATNDALQHAARKLQLNVESAWLPTPSLLEPGARRHARFLRWSVWLGRQPLQKFRRHAQRALSLPASTTAHISAPAQDFSTRSSSAPATCWASAMPPPPKKIRTPRTLSSIPSCAVPNRDPNAPKLSGKISQIRLRPGSYLAAFYGKEIIEEEFFCNYELNPEFEWMAMEAGFPVVARGSKEECRAIESPAHLFFIATLFQPQLSSREDNPHPLIMAPSSSTSPISAASASTTRSWREDVFPFCPPAMKSPAIVEKYKQGPVGFMTIFPSGPLTHLNQPITKRPARPHLPKRALNLFL